ncbi:MAG: hydroxyisourate hydrolase [Chitinophagaceae bacterium]|nr:hydroxyisourate hydrolase [Chitinophagaceae bacterium]
MYNRIFSNQLRFFILTCCCFALSFQGIAQEKTYQLSSHILDISTGKPAAGVTIILSKKENNDQWKIIDEKKTDANGRIKDFLPQTSNNLGIYKLTFHTKPYFKQLGQQSFYPFIEVVFELADNEHYHVPITLSAYGYATYRGN